MRIASRQPSDVVPARVAPLSVLPVFFDLTGRQALVIGGSDAASWKAELLAAAGANVSVYAPREAIGAEMSRLLATRLVAGKIAHRGAQWVPTADSEIAILVADAESNDDAAHIAEQAARAGVPCNVIDRPEHCTFQFGTIVNRSPVVVGISTAGAAPILGQAIRRRIETLLPASLAAWAGMAQRLRDRVTARLKPGQQRRAFWEALADRAFGTAPQEQDEDRLIDAMCKAAAGRGEGHVTFVGAGPGEAELITLKAVRALQAADVILFDDLVSDEVLELARREAKRILVGKRAGRPSCKQSEINDMMVSLARSGRRVVRLKSGDPMIFGRAGEEIDRLEQEGIAYSVVPGITAGAALAAAAGISLTHRDIARQVRFITGHSRKGGLPEDLDLAGIADPVATTIVYMGGRTAHELSSRLLTMGMDAGTPVAIGVALGREGQKVAKSSLARLAEDVVQLAGDDPVVIGIGRAFGRMKEHSVAAAVPHATFEPAVGTRLAG